jgi:hypothetical protein
MSLENVEIVCRDIAARDARDWTALNEIWHPSIELTVLGGGTFRGLNEITAFFDTLSGMHSEYRVEALEVIDGGEIIATVERISGRGLKGSEAAGWHGETLFRAITFRERRMWRVTEYPSRAEALEAAGLTE